MEKGKKTGNKTVRLPNGKLGISEESDSTNRQFTGEKRAIFISGKFFTGLESHMPFHLLHSIKVGYS